MRNTFKLSVVFMGLFAVFAPMIALAQDDRQTQIFNYGTFAVDKLELEPAYVAAAEAQIKQAAEVCRQDGYLCLLRGTADVICGGQPNPEQCATRNGLLASQRAIKVYDILIEAGVPATNLERTGSYETREGLRHVRILAVPLALGTSAEAGRARCSRTCTGLENWQCVAQCLENPIEMVNALGRFGALAGQAIPAPTESALAQQCIDETGSEWDGKVEVSVDNRTGQFNCKREGEPETSLWKHALWGGLIAALAGGTIYAVGMDRGWWKGRVVNQYNESSTASASAALRTGF